MSKADLDVRLAAAQRISELGGQAPQILAALEGVFASPAFRGSRRSREFLRYVVEKSLEGRFEELKERIIGSSLIGRSPDYDTSGDAIVRVIASETRRRLHEYYEGPGRGSSVWFELPSGSYIPSIHLAPGAAEAAAAGGSEAPLAHRQRPGFRPAWYGAMAALSAVCIVLAIQNQGLRRQLKDVKPAASPMPWRALFNGKRGVQLVLADTSVGGIQVLMKSHLSLSDYLNRKFLPEREGASPEMTAFLEYLLRKQFTSASYAITAARIAQIAQLHTTPSRDAILIDLGTDPGAGSNAILMAVQIHRHRRSRGQGVICTWVFRTDTRNQRFRLCSAWSKAKVLPSRSRHPDPLIQLRHFDRAASMSSHPPRTQSHVRRHHRGNA
jgi:hypothetical protein